MCKPLGPAALFAAMMLWASSAEALDQSCPIVEPGHFEFRQVKKNVGIVPPGFVSLGTDVPVAHGVDVSKWVGSVDLLRVQQCGGAFTYVRLSSGTNGDTELSYRWLWAQARNAELLTGPYHSLTLRDSKLPISRLAANERDKLLRVNIDIARQQADLFVDRLREVLSLDAKNETSASDALGLPYLPIALAVNAKPQSRFSPDDAKQYGAIYGAAICAWIDQVHRDRTFVDQSIVLAITPSIYKDYELDQAPCGVKHMPVWVIYPTMDGGREDADAAAPAADAVQLLCRPTDDKNRCLFHQYTAFGGFALQQKDEGLDLDRFYGTIQDLQKLQQQAKTY